MRNALVEFHDMDLVFTKEVCYKIKSHIKKGKHHCQENEVIDAWRNYTDGFMPKYFSKIVGRNWQVFIRPLKCSRVAAWKVSKFRIFFWSVFFPHSSWIWRDTLYLFVFSPNAGIYGPGKTPYFDTSRRE